VWRMPPGRSSSEWRSWRTPDALGGTDMRSDVLGHITTAHKRPEAAISADFAQCASLGCPSGPLTDQRAGDQAGGARRARLRRLADPTGVGNREA
jgi:hypothetical protein